MKARGIDFFAYSASDVRKSIGFYRDVLGLEPIGELEQDGKLIWAEFEVGGACIALHSPEYGPPTGAAALSVEDVDATIAELKSKGVTVRLEPIETAVCKVAVVADPDGNAIFLHQRHDGTVG